MVSAVALREILGRLPLRSGTSSTVKICCCCCDGIVSPASPSSRSATLFPVDSIVSAGGGGGAPLSSSGTPRYCRPCRLRRRRRCRTELATRA
jgi:hypothetical protein